jgi:hypothetical protein
MFEGIEEPQQWAHLKQVLMLPREEFMQTYGRFKAALYHYPTKEEMENLKADPNAEDYFDDSDYDFRDGVDDDDYNDDGNGNGGASGSGAGEMEAD